MNWKGIITFLAIVTGIYFLWMFLSKSENNPANQEAFQPIGGAAGDPVNYEYPESSESLGVIAGDIPSSDPQEAMSYQTVYNIAVEAPEFPEQDESQYDSLIDDIVDKIGDNEEELIPASTGGKNKGKKKKKKKKSYNKRQKDELARDKDPVNAFMRQAKGELPVVMPDKTTAYSVDPNESIHGQKVWVETSQGLTSYRRSGR